MLAGLIGLYLGWLWLAVGNLLVPIVVHALYDFVALMYLVKVRGEGLGIGDWIISDFRFQIWRFEDLLTTNHSPLPPAASDYTA